MTLTMLIRWWTSSDHGLDTHSYWVWWDYCHSPQKYLLSWVEPQNLRHPPGQRLELLLSLQTAGGSGDSPLEWKEGREQVRWRQSQTKLIQKKNSLNNKHYSSKLLSTKKSSQGHTVHSMVSPSVIAPLSKVSPCWRSEASPRSRSLEREAVNSKPATDSAMSAKICSFSVRACTITASLWPNRSTHEKHGTKYSKETPRESTESTELVKGLHFVSVKQEPPHKN